LRGTNGAGVRLAYQVDYFQSVDEVVYLSHEPFHEDHFRKAHAEVFQLGGKRLELAEIV